jgi:hypothetical protein
MEKNNKKIASRKWKLVKTSMVFIGVLILCGIVLSVFDKPTGWVTASLTVLSAVPTAYMGVNAYLKGRGNEK